MRKFRAGVVGALAVVTLSLSLLSPAAASTPSSAAEAGPVQVTEAEHAGTARILDCGGAGAVGLGRTEVITGRAGMAGRPGIRMIYDITMGSPPAVLVTEIYFIDDQNKGQWYRVTALTPDQPHGIWSAPWGNNLAHPKIRVHNGVGQAGHTSVSFTCGFHDGTSTTGQTGDQSTKPEPAQPLPATTTQTSQPAAAVSAPSPA